MLGYWSSHCSVAFLVHLFRDEARPVVRHSQSMLPSKTFPLHEFLFRNMSVGNMRSTLSKYQEKFKKDRQTEFQILNSQNWFVRKVLNQLKANGNSIH